MVRGGLAQVFLRCISVVDPFQQAEARHSAYGVLVSGILGSLTRDHSRGSVALGDIVQVEDHLHGLGLVPWRRVRQGVVRIVAVNALVAVRVWVPRRVAVLGPHLCLCQPQLAHVHSQQSRHCSLNIWVQRHVVD